MLNINGKLKCYRAFKKVLENICILLVWFSCIYKQNFLSLVLFAFLVIYTYHRSSSTLLMIRTIVVLLFVIQYWLEVFNLSYYNSPKPFPSHLVNDINSTRADPYEVYPNAEHYFYDIPIMFAYNRTVSSEGMVSAYANLNYTSYLGMDAENRKLNGIWIDFTMTIAVAVYFSLCNFWMLFRPVKVTHSKETKKKL